MHIQDTLDREQNTYNLSGHAQNPNQKWALQNLYKQQLDNLMGEKNRQRQADRNKEIMEKREFNERANNNKESEKIKEQAYKNYYNMLLSNQQQLQSSYVSPYSIRDSMKEQHINHSVEEGEHRLKQWEVEERRRNMEKKNMYRSELMNQIEERKRLETRNHEDQIKKKQQFRKYGKLPDEINKYERQRHLEEMSKYKEDLDKVKQEREFFKTRSLSEHQNVRLQSDQHNALINPLPYNIQNPYILREMNQQSYLANRGSQNFPNSREHHA